MRYDETELTYYQLSKCNVFSGRYAVKCNMSPGPGTSHDSVKKRLRFAVTLYCLWCGVSIRSA